MEATEKRKEEAESNVPFKIPGPPPNPKRALVLEAAQDNLLDDRDEIPVAGPEQAADIPEAKSNPAVNDMSTSTELQLSLEEFQVPFRASHLQQNCENSQEMMISKHNTDNHHQASFEVYNHPLAASYQHQKPDRVMSSTQINNNNDQTASGSFPVSYSKQNGGVAVINDTSTPQPDGTQVIQTSQYQSPSAGRYESDRPLTKRYQQILKILSVVAAIVFFPIGIPAVYYAFKTEKEFNAGILRGDISLAQKYGKRAEKFIIFSYLLFVMVVILSFTVHERSKWNDSDWDGHRILPG